MLFSPNDDRKIFSWVAQLPVKNIFSDLKKFKNFDQKALTQKKIVELIGHFLFIQIKDCHMEVPLKHMAHRV